MPRSHTKPKVKTAAELKAEVREGQVRVEKDTKVVALETGYCDVIREPGDVFYIKKGTIYTPGVSWFEPVDESTPTAEETNELSSMTVSELKIELAQAGVDFAGVTKKDDLVALLAKHRAEGDLA